MKKNIYILHEYYTPSHFKALYDECEKYGYKIKDYIIISEYSCIKRMLKTILKNKQFILPIKEYINNKKKFKKIKSDNDNILIVGIAPYNKLMKKYKKIFKSNYTIYFTSWTYWDKEDKYEHKGISRKEYINIINDTMKGVACVSSTTEKTIKGILNTNIKTSEVKHSIDVDEYKKKEIVNENIYKSRCKKFIFLGKLINRKNVDLIIQWINQSNEKFEFYFAGNGNLKSEIIDLSNKDSRVKYLGVLNKQTIKETLREYDYMVLPSKEEPYGIVLIEAMAAGIPCIVSNAIGPAEIITNEKNGFVIEGEVTIDSLEKVFRKSINLEYEKYENMHKHCVECSKKYSTETNIKKWIELI